VTLIILGYLARWQSGNLIKPIESVLSGFTDRIDRFQRILSRNRQGIRRSRFQAIKKLSPLVTGLFLTFFGVYMFSLLVLIPSYPGSVINSYSVLAVVVIILMQSWIVVAVLAAFKLRRTTIGWWVLYFLYPFVALALSHCLHLFIWQTKFMYYLVWG
jgi:hypothetical protein